MNEQYLEWLLNRAEVNDDETGFSELCRVLHGVIFHPIMEMDENRWEDGVGYRVDFAEAHANSDDILDELDAELGGCTMLELILSLAEKMWFELAESQYEAGVGKWFEELISNLGLDIYTNREMADNPDAETEVENILERMIFRRYHYDGRGGLFPLNYAEEDQRDAELTVQMNQYIAENYDILGG